MHNRQPHLRPSNWPAGQLRPRRVAPRLDMVASGPGIRLRCDQTRHPIRHASWRGIPETSTAFDLFSGGELVTRKKC